MSRRSIPSKTAIRGKAVAVLLGAGAIAGAVPAQAAELITNGNFSAGTTGYQTQYTGTDATGYQYLSTNPRSICGCFADIDGNTNGHGNQLILDGAASGGYFFRQTVGIVAGTTYTLSFDAVNLGTAGPIPNIAASINGLTVLTSGPLMYDNVYRTFSVTFAAGTATSAVISLTDLTMDHSYNDFAIDNVSFVGAAPAATGGVPEPATWAMMLLGFGGMGYAMRRRSGTSARIRFA